MQEQMILSLNFKICWNIIKMSVYIYYVYERIQIEIYQMVRVKMTISEEIFVDPISQLSVKLRIEHIVKNLRFHSWFLNDLLTIDWSLLCKNKNFFNRFRAR